MLRHQVRIRRFECFRHASGLSAKLEENQVNTLIYSMGNIADKILQSFNLSQKMLKSAAQSKTNFMLTSWKTKCDTQMCQV